MRRSTSLKRVNLALLIVAILGLAFLGGVELGRFQASLPAPAYVLCTPVSTGTTSRCPPEHEGPVLAQFSQGWRLATYHSGRWWIFGAGPAEPAETLPTDWVELAQVQGRAGAAYPVLIEGKMSAGTEGQG